MIFATDGVQEERRSTSNVAADVCRHPHTSQNGREYSKLKKQTTIIDVAGHLRAFIRIWELFGAAGFPLRPPQSDLNRIVTHVHRSTTLERSLINAWVRVQVIMARRSHARSQEQTV